MPPNRPRSQHRIIFISYYLCQIMNYYLFPIYHKPCLLGKTQDWRGSHDFKEFSRN